MTRFFALFISSFLPTLVLGQADCVLKRNEHHLKIYTCSTADSKFKAVKVSLQAESTVSQAAAMILDVDRYQTWQFGTVRASVLKTVSPYELYYYHEVHAPLVDNRDFAVRLTMKQDEVTKELTVEAVSVPDFIPSNENIVRVPYSKATWSIKPLGHRLIQVNYYVEVDLGGQLPAWIVNPLAPKASYETFDGFRKEIAKYHGKQVSFVTD